MQLPRSNHDRLPIFTSILFLILLAICTPAFAASGKTAADYYIKSLPGAPAGDLLKMHAGHVEVSEEAHGNLFFWHYQNRHIGDRQRTVIWLNGGPGCSSMDGALMEVGPYRVREGGHLEYNNGSWDEFANLLFVDNPVGTGFSYVDTNAYLHELDEMATQFIKFLEEWMKIFPEYAQDDLYIAGESYAGQHIPYIARAILDRNKRATSSRSAPWNLAGLLIGNGWISGPDQYPAYLKFSYEEGLLERGSQLANNIERKQTACLKQLAHGGGDKVDEPVCEQILQELLTDTMDRSRPKDQQCINMYDIRLRDDQSCGMNWPPDLSTVTPYLRRNDVRKALNVDPQKNTGWRECAAAVSDNFRARNSTPSIKFLPDILEAGVPIVLFSGDKDLICNHIGTEQLIHRLSWLNGTGFETEPSSDVWAPKRNWTFEGKPAGIYQSARNLTYVRFFDASHMVPFDWPRRSRDMLDRFMGVDIGSIGGEPTDSRIDGEKGKEVSVGGHPDSDKAKEEQAGKVKTAQNRAYMKSGEIVLFFVVVAAAVWGWWIWRQRRRARMGYVGVGVDPDEGGGPPGRRDLEAADFDEAELDDLSHVRDGEKRYSIGGESSDDEDEGRGLAKANGHR
ncbi:MAG: hypothetical protein Q9162_005644 [Coniocarpon cinnabarinum]